MLSLKYIIIPILIAVLSQSIKVLLELIKYKKISLKRYINGQGGMPSTHSALVSSLSTIIFLDYGISVYFSITLIFSLIIIYDSMGIRYESGKQAQVLNEISGSKLNERIGHKPLEVLMGVLLGITLTIIINIIIK